MIETLVLAVPAALGLTVPRILRRRAPGARRWRLLVGAPVLALMISYLLMAAVWALLRYFAPELGQEGYDVRALAHLIDASVAGMVLAPLTALGAAIWITRKPGRTE